jgi:hypothetical protein
MSSARWARFTALRQAAALHVLGAVQMGRRFRLDSEAREIRASLGENQVQARPACLLRSE